VLKWFIVQATKLKTPEPNALLRRYASKLEPSDREAFGQFVLDAWLGEDEAGGRAIDAKGLLAVAAACGGAQRRSRRDVSSRSTTARARRNARRSS
jgi:hypothetical protein